MKVIDKNEGPKIAYEVSGTRITFGDEDLMINLAKYQRSYENHIDVYTDQYGTLQTGLSLYYVAQIDIPRIEYEPQEGPEEGVEQEPAVQLPLDMEKVTLTLWALN